MQAVGNSEALKQGNDGSDESSNSDDDEMEYEPNDGQDVISIPRPLAVADEDETNAAGPMQKKTTKEKDERKRDQIPLSEMIKEFLTAVKTDKYEKNKHSTLSANILHHAVQNVATDEQIKKKSAAEDGVSKTVIMDWIASSDVYKKYIEALLTKIEITTYQRNVSKALAKGGYTRLGTTSPHLKWFLPGQKQGENKKGNTSNDVRNSANQKPDKNESTAKGQISTTEGGVNARDVFVGDRIKLKDDDDIMHIGNKIVEVELAGGDSSTELSRYGRKDDDLVPLCTRYGTLDESDDESLGASSSCLANGNNLNYHSRGKTNEMNTCNREVTSRMEEPEWDDDSNPWLGCVCGETHESPIPVFWVQCDSCDAWFNCATDCVGFSSQDAGHRGDWQCPDCLPLDLTAQGEKIIQTSRSSNRGVAVFPTGTVVDVEDRTWAGSNKPGGVARVIAHHVLDDDINYDVRYILESRTERVKGQYVSMNQTMTIGFMSPAKNTRSS